ncbi:hypothetical protein N4A85_24990, partial [Escherichia coli]|uniref:hypothetical protein n=1 Tax=Escherichia coli TaxID=562 RepID=UPI0021B5D42F
VKGAVAFAAKKANVPAPAKTTGPDLEMWIQSTAPKLLPLAPADVQEATDLLKDGREKNGGYGSPAKTASRLVLMNRLAAAPRPEG